MKYYKIQTTSKVTLCLLIFMVYSVNVEVSATFEAISNAAILLRGIEASSIELRINAAQCRPFIGYLIQRLSIIAGNLYGYDELLINNEHAEMEKCAWFIKSRGFLPPNTLKCIDGNLGLARELMKRLRSDSTCLRRQLQTIGDILRLLLGVFVGDPLGPCPIPIICVITRTGISSLVISVKALISLLVNLLRLVLALLRFNSRLQTCRRDLNELRIIYKVTCDNFQLCTYIVN